MANNNTILPNPLTPLAFLSPTLAHQAQVSGYFHVATIGAFIWDWLMSVPQEYRMVSRSGLSLQITTYFVARVGTLAFCITGVVFQIAPVAHCQALLYICGSTAIVTLPANALLFFFRVRAVYCKSKIVTRFFGFLWVALLGTTFIVPFALKGDHIGPTQRCINTSVRSAIMSSIIINTVNSTLIFLAVSLRIVFKCSLVGDTWRARARSFFVGDGLPRVSKAFLQAGQLFYFVTIGLQIASAIMTLLPIPAVYQAMLPTASVALENVMASRVFHAVLFGIIEDPQQTPSILFATIICNDMVTKSCTIIGPSDTNGDTNNKRSLDGGTLAYHLNALEV